VVLRRKAVVFILQPISWFAKSEGLYVIGARERPFAGAFERVI
jgi:hypothetical protein